PSCKLTQKDFHITPSGRERPGQTMHIPSAKLGAQIAAIFRAWGMADAAIGPTVRNMLAADLRGIDSHGVMMLPLYDQLRREGRLEMQPEVKVVRESPVTALVDGGGGLGHYPGDMAMKLAIEKAARAGLAAVGVRNSNHYGAAGVYALQAVERGLIGIAMTNVWGAAVVPTRSAAAMFGTNPIAFAAPGGKNPPFCLDMATSTVAVGKLKLAALHGKPLPRGWACDAGGNITTDAPAAVAARLLTPLGGTPGLSSHKGYGLAAMVEILCAMLTGAWFAPTRERRHPGAKRFNVGHFFMALDPKAFRSEGEFEEDLDDMIAALRAAKPLDPAQPVLVHGDPERAHFVERSRIGIPVPPALADQLRAIATGCSAEVLI
ncbi:MAG: Ldh family oxidoreductase, partial [Burkholderiales bacterium]